MGNNVLTGHSLGCSLSNPDIDLRFGNSPEILYGNTEIFTRLSFGRNLTFVIQLYEAFLEIMMHDCKFSVFD
jgi:hypothetical protein